MHLLHRSLSLVQTRPGDRCYLWGIRCQRLSWTLATLGRPHHSCPRRRKNTAELLLGAWPWPRGLHMSVIYRVYPVGLVSCGGTTNYYKFSSFKKTAVSPLPVLGAGGAHSRASRGEPFLASSSLWWLRALFGCFLQFLFLCGYSQSFHSCEVHLPASH